MSLLQQKRRYETLLALEEAGEIGAVTALLTIWGMQYLLAHGDLRQRLRRDIEALDEQINERLSGKDVKIDYVEHHVISLNEIRNFLFLFKTLEEFAMYFSLSQTEAKSALDQLLNEEIIDQPIVNDPNAYIWKIVDETVLPELLKMSIYVRKGI